MLYPVAVALTIVVTGNHFILDAIIGYAVMGAGFLLARVFLDRPLTGSPTETGRARAG